MALCLEKDEQKLPKIDGRVHVALPLVDEVFWGMHANVFADTTPDRRKLLRSQEVCAFDTESSKFRERGREAGRVKRKVKENRERERRDKVEAGGGGHGDVIWEPA